MDRRDLDEIERFLTSVGRPTLFAYYALEPTADAAAVEDAIKKRRTWAQGQQSNPKYKSEALFLIKNNSLLKRVLLDHLDAYRAHVADDTQHRNLDVLTLFIRGTIASGQLTPQAEAAILHQGRQLELADAAIARRITELLAETGAQRVGFEAEDLSTEAMAIDHYAILGIATNAAPTAIEEAYRARYRWARNLKDLKRSAEVLHALDQAWRILSDPARRVRYDERRLQMLEVTDEVEKRAAALMGLLGGPEDAITGEAPLPGAPPSPVHEVGYRPATAPPGTRLPLGDPRAPAAEPAPVAAPVPPAATSSPNLAPPLPEPPPIRLAPRTDGFDRAPRAPAPPPVSGRTIGLAAGPQAVATLGPRLAVDGPDVVAVEVRGRPVARRWTVRNAGQGRMPGRVVSDREWLRVEQARLDPVAPNQIVKVTVLPKQMPWGKTAGTVTFVTDHGERRTVTVQAHRRSWLPVVAGVLAVGFVGILAVAAVVFGRPAPESLLALSVSPVADHVFVNGQDLGAGTSFAVKAPKDGQPFQLRVEADGFAPQEELVTLRSGERTERRLELSLEDDMKWMPPAGVSGVDAPAPVRAAIEGSAAALAPCFAGATSPAEATYTAWVTGDGQVRRVAVTKANFPVEPAEACIRRVFRGLRLPPFEGNHAAIEARLVTQVSP